MGYVFVSYARDEAKTVIRVLNKLKKHNLKFWRDVDNIKAGEDWSKKIIEAIKGCESFLLFMSELSMKSDNIEREVHAAFKHKKDIIMLRLDQAKVPPALDYQIGRLHWIEHSSPKWETDIVIALDGKKNSHQIPKVAPKQPAQPLQRKLSVTKDHRKPQTILEGLEFQFSENRRYYRDECDEAILQLEELKAIVGSHWINPALAYKELVPRQYLLDKIEVIQNLIQDFRDAQPSSSYMKRQFVQGEIKKLIQELNQDK